MNISEVMDLTSSYVYSIGENDTYWDIYVALHVFWHNLGRVYSIRRIEHNLPYDAVVFFFLDDNIREGKIWYYMHQCACIPGISRE